MAIVSLVLESALGANEAGSVIQCESEVAESLCSAGLAREATADDVNQPEPDGDEPKSEDTDTPEIAQDSLDRVARHAHDTVVKATEKAVEKLATSVKRPAIGRPANVHVSGSDELLTGGFKNLGEATQAFLAKSRGDYEAARKFSRYSELVRKSNMSISGSSGHVGGDLVPQQWAQNLWKLAFDKVPDLLGMMTRYPMENQVMNIPSWVQTSATSGVTASVVSEGGSITDSTGVTATVQLSLVKGAALVNVTDELMRFNSYALTTVLEQVVPQRIRYLTNGGVVNGTNSQINLIGNPATVVVPRATNNRIELNDIFKMEASLYDDFVDDAVWLVNNSTMPELYTLAFPNRSATTQFPALTPGNMLGNLAGPKPAFELLGKPVYRLENVPALGSKGDIILASLRSLAAGYTGLFADATPYLYFSTAVDSFRFLFYYDSVNPMTAPYVRADGSYSSNIVVLSASS